MSTRAPKSRRHSVLGFAVALLFLAGQLSSFTHLLLVQHATCAEHGELIHVTEAVAPAHAELPSTAAYLAAMAVSNGHGHDHCLLSATRREKLHPPSVLARVASAAAPLSSPSIARSVTPHLNVALLRLAPKSSPPA